MFLFPLSKGDTWSTMVTQVSAERMHLRLVENTQLAWSRVWLLSCLNLAWISVMPDCYHISLTCDLARLCFLGPYETLGKYLWKQDTLHLSNFLFHVFGFVNGAESVQSGGPDTKEICGSQATWAPWGGSGSGMHWIFDKLVMGSKLKGLLALSW